MNTMLFTVRTKRTYPSECRRCGGQVVEGLAKLTLPQSDGSLRVVEGAPAGICDLCHEEYLSVDTSRQIDQLLKISPSRRQLISVWDFPQGSVRD